MSDLNLENIVGFKAVDKNGNEQNVTVDEMVDMVSTRMVMALSETSTFAAAAATGNDVYENELPTVTDAANVRVLQSSGDAAQMTMQSLASKLGELMNSLRLFPFMFREKISGETDFNTYRKSGTYHLDGVKSSLPFSYGGLIVFNCNILIVQIVCNLKINDYYIRNNWNNEKWTPWAKIGTTTEIR